MIKPVDRTTVHRWWQCQWQWWRCQWWHTMDNSWLHRLICYQQMSQKLQQPYQELVPPPQGLHPLLRQMLDPPPIFVWEKLCDISGHLMIEYTHLNYICSIWGRTRSKMAFYVSWEKQSFSSSLSNPLQKQIMYFICPHHIIPQRFSHDLPITHMQLN